MLGPFIKGEFEPTMKGNLSIMCGSKVPLNMWGPIHGILNFKMEGRVETGFELKTACSDTMIDYHLSQKLKMWGNGDILTITEAYTKDFII